MQRINSYLHVEQQTDMTDFVSQHAILIKKIALHIKATLPPHIELDDLLQSGLIGLLEAKANFSPEKGASFTTYAAIKIRGAIIDELRKNSGITRDIGQNMKRIAEAITKIENSMQHNHPIISAKMIAEEMGISLEKYEQMEAEINTYKSISTPDTELIEELPSTDFIDPSTLVENDDIRKLVKKMILMLPQREQIILALYYNEQLNFKEIASVLNLTEARISQLHQQCLIKIKKRCNEHMGK
ncbi:RNA polymerase sigma factor FliA [Legionella nagasakiensis]|uniref:RNA polymerase sigma factor FliA n=1 Tax=Legionella nagasakiensis TaxID=535290 RepID=UPI0013EF9698|nr:RNA polymerase sigma factor FliA [Legionella nagasakiensis]